MGKLINKYKFKETETVVVALLEKMKKEGDENA